MIKKRWAILGIIVLFLNIIWLLAFNNEPIVNAFFIFKNFIFNSAASLGKMLIMIIRAEFSISVLSPENISYSFNKGDNYTLDLNVSATQTVSIWWFTLKDLKHNQIVNESVLFLSNLTFNAVRWSNELVVYANSTDGSHDNKTVVFFVYVPNSAPVLGAIESQIFVCEGHTLPAKVFQVSDGDEDSLTVDISPADPFYVGFPSIINLTTSSYQIYSGVLDKVQANKTYQEVVFVDDNNGLIDTKYLNITVIAINNAPSVEEIGAQTVWTSGENNIFYKQVKVTDTEEGNQNSGLLNFNITFLNSAKLFNISSVGLMSFDPEPSQAGVYNISVCVKDRGIDAHPNISLCSQNGTPITTCINFTLTVTDANRAPEFTRFYPTTLAFQISSTDDLIFNITTYDADGTIPDAYWYADSVFEKYKTGSSVSNLSWNFGCGISGNHSVKAVISDGLLNSSLQWNLSVTNVPCGVPGLGGGGGGGGGRLFCYEKWGCSGWGVCSDMKTSSLSSKDTEFAEALCASSGFGEKICGFQLRKCQDLNACNLTKDKPDEIRACYYTPFPSCSDKIQNCHDGNCELGVDCGGPCTPCPTCSDGIQNQGEGGIDCGGPCPVNCPIELPLRKAVWWYIIIVFLLLLIVLLAIIIKIVRIMKYRRRIRRVYGG